ncbi:MAG TPA: NAD(P)-binding domain-containing protein [Actinomycetota bacterium]|nr:NAD(P)-binding domain-containing protein [Actinomycetota bacterium]
MLDAAAAREADVIVVGAGPTGIAALFEARRLGLSAVGLEAGSSPAASIRDYLSGLVLISRPTDYEVAGLPLDCRDPNQLTREDVLHYLGRVVNYGALDIREGEPVRSLTPAPGPGEWVLVETPSGTWQARHVVVTTWYRSRPPPPGLVNPDAGVRVITALHDGVEVAGRETVVVGGGLSAFEHATAVMLHGQRVTIVSRHRLPAAFRTPHFETLLAVTGSEVVEHAAELRLGERGLEFRWGIDAALRRVPCECLVLCLGHEVDPAVQEMLTKAGVLTPEEVEQVRASPTPDTMIRHGRPLQEAIAAALAAWPDFRTKLIGGVGGIRLAGGGLHIGGAHSGVRVSMRTAVLAVRDAAGVPPGPELGAGLPLPMAMARFVQMPPEEATPEVLGPIRPLRIAAWSRTAMALRSRDNFEASPQPVPGRPVAAGQSPYLLAPHPDDPVIGQILALADGSHSVADLREHLGRSVEVRRLLGALRYLWQNNALTWLPPVAGPPRPGQGG